MRLGARAGAIVMSATLLAGLVTGLPSASSAGVDAPAPQDVVITGASTIYPNRADDTQPTGTTFSFVPTVEGNYILEVRFRSPAERRLVRCAHLDASSDAVDWRWDGLDGNREPPPRGLAFATLAYAAGDRCRNPDESVGESDWIRIVNSTGYARQRDLSDREDVPNVDLKEWSLTNAARTVTAELTFYKAQRLRRWESMYTLIGTPQTSKRGSAHAYQVSYFRRPPPGWSRWMLGWTVPGEYDTGVKRIRCRGFDHEFAVRRVVVTIPKRCLDHGDRKLKMAAVSVQDRAGHFDSGARLGRWVKYSDWSIYQPVS